MKFILGRKIGMTQIFSSEGEQIPVTLILAGPCYISQVKKPDKDGYCAVQVAFEKTKSKNVRKPVLGHLEKRGIKDPFKVLVEFRVPEGEVNNFKEGEVLDVSLFAQGDAVKVTGFSKGKMFQGGVKRWGFSGRDATHGVKHEHRTIGSVGIQKYGKVLKGKRMPGRTGGEKVTVRSLKVALIDKESGILAVKGAVPGRKDTLLKIQSLN